VLAAAVQLDVNAAFTNSGTVEIAGLAELSASGGYTQTAGTTRLQMSATLASGGTPIAIDGGVLEGIGTLQGSVVNGARIAPGLPIGPLFLSADYTQAAAGTLAIEIGGRTALTDYDALEVTSAATLAGALEVSLTDGFVPSNGDEFTVLSAGSIAGTFDSSTVVVGGGIGFTVIVGATDVVLRAAVEDCDNSTDDDGDGDADCADAKCADLPACGGTPTSTPTVTPTRNPSLPTFTPTPTPTVTPTVNPSLPSATPTATPTPSPTPTEATACPGDCNSNRAVTIDELAKGVDLATRNASTSGCPAIDGDDNDRVSVDEIIAAVNEALAGCR